MSNTRVGLLIGSGMATGVALMYATRTRSRKRSLLARTGKQVTHLKYRASKLADTAVDLIGKGRVEAERQKKGLAQAVEAGMAAYQKAVS